MSSDVLQLSDIFVTMRWDNSVIMVPSDNEHSWVLLLFDGVKWRIFHYKVNITLISWDTSILFTPCCTHCKLIKPKHICNRDTSDDWGKQVWSLICNGSYECSSIRATLNAQMVSVSVSSLNEIFSGSYEIVITILLFVIGSISMPFLAIFSTTSNTSYNIDNV